MFEHNTQIESYEKQVKQHFNYNDVFNFDLTVLCVNKKNKKGSLKWVYSNVSIFNLSI